MYLKNYEVWKAHLKVFLTIRETENVRKKDGEKKICDKRQPCAHIILSEYMRVRNRVRHKKNIDVNIKIIFDMYVNNATRFKLSTMIGFVRFFACSVLSRYTMRYLCRKKRITSTTPYSCKCQSLKRQLVSLSSRFSKHVTQVCRGTSCWHRGLQGSLTKLFRKC